MFYNFHELNHAAIAPMRAYADALRFAYESPANPFSKSPMVRSLSAGLEVFERTTRRYGKPDFGLETTQIDGKTVAVEENIIWSKPFCDLLHFKRDLPKSCKSQPKILLVAPMSGHYATLLRGTVETLLPHAEIYITDWTDARIVPKAVGSFDLDDYIDYIIDMFDTLGPDTHVMSVCQPSVPVLAAVSLMEARKSKNTPRSMTLMGGPIDTRVNPTGVNKLAQSKPLSWFEENVIMSVPWPLKGFGRRVYPGFLQLSGFMSMNLDKHVEAKSKFFMNLVKGDGDTAEKHREFYDEYMAVMDLTEEFYLQTVDVVFITHALPKGEMMHRGELVDTRSIKKCALFTIEGENDDITGVGQTQAAHTLCPNIPKTKREHYMQPDVGHYGVFSGSRFRKEIAPRILKFTANLNNKVG
ncbi:MULTISPECIES: polyhydroxyalkanoate depolymerase [unclassified Lentilitoribacter]|jgi:poly(3-hydroxybutyrate) depolymerase|uniref:polyhydroxyalkanoate depolymerase n=1 Tax=unclassified Lentilitoribacter TaxID=2647570 RepID=UPI0013A6BE89|nr:polyhydroxyalkanoate depolymerase [Lentilitoribacter sp. Alg239-R112]